MRKDRSSGCAAGAFIDAVIERSGMNANIHCGAKNQNTRKKVGAHKKPEKHHHHTARESSGTEQIKLRETVK